MSKEEILKGNKLIASFMDIDDSILHDHQGMYLYHSSWDWLMDVIKKIVNLNLKISPSIHRMYFNTFRCRKTKSIESIYKIRLHSDFKDIEFKCDSNNEIEATYFVVIEFIKWYNQNKLNEAN